MRVELSLPCWCRLRPSLFIQQAPRRCNTTPCSTSAPPVVPTPTPCCLWDTVYGRQERSIASPRENDCFDAPEVLVGSGGQDRVCSECCFQNTMSSGHGYPCASPTWETWFRKGAKRRVIPARGHRPGKPSRANRERQVPAWTPKSVMRMHSVLCTSHDVCNKKRSATDRCLLYT